MSGGELLTICFVTFCVCQLALKMYAIKKGYKPNEPTQTKAGDDS